MVKLYYSNARSRAITEVKKNQDGAWVHVVAPKEQEFADLAKKYDLDEDLLRDAVDLYESPRIERDGDNVYVFTRYHHDDNGVINATEPLLIVYKPDALITVARIDSAVLLPLFTGREAVITTQRTKTLLQILEAVNYSYRSYLNRVTRRILSIRSELHRFDLNSEAVLSFIEVEDDLNEFASALEPQAAMLRNLLGGKYLKLYEEDRDLIEDLSLGTKETIELVNSRLKTIVSIREAYDAVAAGQLNRTFRRLTSISIFLMIPTVFSGLYGMNVRLPFADSPNAFGIVVLVVLLMSTLAVVIFQRKRWL